MFKKILLIIFLIIAAIIALRNFIADPLLSFLISRKLRAECSMEKIDIGLSGLKVNNFSLKKEGLILFLDQAGFTYSYDRFSPRITSFFCRGGNIELGKDALSLSVPVAEAKEDYGLSFFPPVDIDLSRIRLAVDDRVLGVFSGLISFSGTIKGRELVLIRDIGFEQGEWSWKDLRIQGLYVTRAADDVYTVKIPSFYFRDKEIGEIVFPFKVALDRVEIIKSPQPLFGPAGSMEAQIRKKDRDLLCLRLAGENISFKPLISLAREKEDISLEGLFSGDLTVCLKGMKPLFVQGSMSNRLGGMVNIKNEASLGFLGKYLDKASYSRIIDNLKNYAYNEGVISFSTKGPDVIAALNFDSEKMGKRDFVITFHDFLGGVQ